MFETSTRLLEDHRIRLTGIKSSKLYSKELRLIKYCDKETGEVLTFISNMTDELELNGLEIANIYRHRWDVESFFKLIKQNLTVKHLLGCSENAVKTHLMDCNLFVPSACQNQSRLQQPLFHTGNQDADQRISLDQERSEGPRNRATTAHYKSGCQ